MDQDQDVQYIKVDDLEHRVGTGAVQFNDDWPGYFMRGDSCMGFVMNLGPICELLLDENGRLKDFSELSDGGKVTIEWGLRNLINTGIDMEDNTFVKHKKERPTWFNKIRKIHKDLEEAIKDELG